LKVELVIYAIVFSILGILIGIYLLKEVFKDFNLKNAFLGTIAFVTSAMLLGIPVIDKIFNSNPGFHSILTQKEMIEDSGLKLYGFDAYSLEIWFKYGKIIPEVRPENPRSEEHKSELQSR